MNDDDLVECIGVAHCEGYEYEAKQATTYVLGLEASVEDLQAKLANAVWLLIDATVQLEEGKIKTRRNRATLIRQFLETLKGGGA